MTMINGSSLREKVSKIHNGLFSVRMAAQLEGLHKAASLSLPTDFLGKVRTLNTR